MRYRVKVILSEQHFNALFDELGGIFTHIIRDDLGKNDHNKSFEMWRLAETSLEDRFAV